MMKIPVVALFCAFCTSPVSGFAFVPSAGSRFEPVSRGGLVTSHKSTSLSPRTSSGTSTSLRMLDQNIIMGAGIAVVGLGVGIGLVAFTEAQGERAKERGSGLSENMSTRIAGQLMEDVEVSSVQDLGSLTSQLEQALKESGSTGDDEFEMTEEEKKRIEEEADDGW